jgi:hypothetical protein
MQSIVLAQSANERRGGAFTEVCFQLGNEPAPRNRIQVSGPNWSDVMHELPNRLP